MREMIANNGHASVAGKDDLILITGAGGFIGRRVVTNLLDRGFQRLRCFVRPSSDATELEAFAKKHPPLEITRGNLLSPQDCQRAANDAAIVYHLAAGRGEKSFADAFMNSVVTTRNLIEAILQTGRVRRFVNISSFTVYTRRNEILEENCPVETKPVLRGEAYCFAKSHQERLLTQYGQTHAFPYVTLRPGYVYGPGNEAISSRVGIGTFGLFLHLGGGNKVPLSYVDNCAEAIVLAGLKRGIDREIINVVDDDLPTSRQFLSLYKKKVKRFRSISLPRWLSYLLCALWEDYSNWSNGQLPPAYNRRMWHAYWKQGSYSNKKLKNLLGWSQVVSTSEALERYFESCRRKLSHA